VSESKSTRSTVELCGAQFDGSPCVRERGHDGNHEIIPNARRPPDAPDGRYQIRFRR
jgi:hypothetical protein